MRMRLKPWTEPVLEACPFFIEAPSSRRGHWRALFAEDRPLRLEIGCGKGVGTARMAHAERGANLIAVDEVRHVLAVSVKNIAEEYGADPVDNLLLSCVDATRIHDTFAPEDGIERIYIHFYNPWNEKAKHHKRRLTHPRQLMQYRAFLKQDGEIWMKTDDQGLFMASKRYLDECGFAVTYATDDLAGSGFSPNYVTEHEQHYIDQGCRIHFLIARMLDDTHLKKPIEE